MENKIGIWIDSEEAHVIKQIDQSWSLETIDSDIEHFHIRGGSGSSTPYGPQDVVSDKKLLERKKHQQNDFFKKLFPIIWEAEEIVIFGPGEIKNQFTRQMMVKPELKNIVVNTVTCDSITENQLIAMVRDYFQ